MRKIVETVEHLKFALLCPINRRATMMKKNCNELELFENPNWLLEHYFLTSGVLLTEDEKNDIVEFSKTRNGRQIVEAFLCPVNRDCTRREYNCDDEYFVQGENHNTLIVHYLANGGACAFAERRKLEHTASFGEK